MTSLSKSPTSDTSLLITSLIPPNLLKGGVKASQNL